MTRILSLILCFGFVAACDSGGGDVLQAHTDGAADPDGGDGSEDDPDTNPIDSDGELPPGTEFPAAENAIFRTEPFTEEGNGYVRAVRFDSENNTFFVEGLGFDSSQPDGQEYARSNPDTPPGTSFALFEAPAFFPDSLTGTRIPQFEHRALYGQSDSGETEFAIVRTGAYVQYGFGGFIYQRNGGVVLPEEGQATYAGDYAAIRDFDGRGGLEYATGDARLDIDFSGFRGNCNSPECDNAVRGRISGRRIFDTDGNDISNQYVTAINEEYGGNQIGLPNIVFRIGPGVADINGEVTGEAFSTVSANEGQAFEVYEEGRYYAILSGNHAANPGGEIVGVVVVENPDPRVEGIMVRETGGFIVVRD